MPLDLKTKVKFDDMTLIGHGHGDGITTIKYEEDSRIKKLITLAGVSDFKVSHPWEKDSLPSEFKEAIYVMIDFAKRK